MNILHVDPAQRVERDFGRDAFDRIGFAAWVTRQLALANTTVILYGGARELRVERGRDLARGPGASFVLVGVPEGASREHIATSLIALSADPPPYLLEVLLAGNEHTLPQ